MSFKYKSYHLFNKEYFNTKDRKMSIYLLRKISIKKFSKKTDNVIDE